MVFHIFLPRFFCRMSLLYFCDNLIKVHSCMWHYLWTIPSYFRGINYQNQIMRGPHFEEKARRPHKEKILAPHATIGAYNALNLNFKNNLLFCSILMLTRAACLRPLPYLKSCIPPLTMYHSAPFVIPSANFPHAEVPMCMLAWLLAYTRARCLNNLSSGVADTFWKISQLYKLF